jgi:TetR/AcrR family tetracycline transcriptional repressor
MAKAAPKKAPEQKLTREQIAAIARELLAEVGIEGLTMRRLGEACGVKGPALYWHFKDKDELVGQIVDSVVADLYAGRPDQPWPERLLVVGRSCRQLLLDHPGLAIAVSRGYSLQERVLAGMDGFLAALTDAGFSYEEAVAIHFTVLTFTIGFVIYEDGSPTFAALRSPAGSDQRSESRQHLEALAGDRYPHLAKAAGALEGMTVDEVYEQGLTALVQGWVDRLGAAG